jgi:hypothetical protein
MSVSGKTLTGHVQVPEPQKKHNSNNKNVKAYGFYGRKKEEQAGYDSSYL